MHILNRETLENFKCLQDTRNSKPSDHLLGTYKLVKDINSKLFHEQKIFELIPPILRKQTTVSSVKRIKIREAVNASKDYSEF